MSTARLIFSSNIWNHLIHGLRIRGENMRESGAFLLGSLENYNVTKCIFYDELDPEAFDTGIIVFNGEAYMPLWDQCIKNNMRVIGDVHTHPRAGVGQSKLDNDHPMIVQKGHLALIIPYFASNEVQKLRGIGIHEYMGDLKWKR